MASTIIRELPGQTVFRFAKPRPKLGRRAWRVSVDGFEDSIYGTDRRGKAIARAFHSLRALGYLVQWSSVRCRRAPEYDAYWRTDRSEHGFPESAILEFRRDSDGGRDDK